MRLNHKFIQMCSFDDSSVPDMDLVCKRCMDAISCSQRERQTDRETEGERETEKDRARE